MTASVVSLRQASLALGVDRKYLKGYAQALGVKLEPVAKALLMSRRDFEMIQSRLVQSESADPAVAPRD